MSMMLYTQSYNAIITTTLHNMYIQYTLQPIHNATHIVYTVLQMQAKLAGTWKPDATFENVWYHKGLMLSYNLALGCWEINCASLVCIL
jgi:hypothetical protein